MRKTIFVLALAASLAGCASVQQAVQAYGSVAVTSAKAANDTAIEAYKVALCATPVSAVRRHPELVPAIKSLCLVPGDAATGALIEGKP
jgi:uncharacterized protein YceK